MNYLKLYAIQINNSVYMFSIKTSRPFSDDAIGPQGQIMIVAWVYE